MRRGKREKGGKRTSERFRANAGKAEGSESFLFVCKEKEEKHSEICIMKHTVS